MKKKNLILSGLGALAAIAATIFLLKKKNAKDAAEKPPSHAPQLHLDNPGDQSEFPQSASESDIG